MPDFTIVVPVYREGLNINACLRHLTSLHRIDRAEVVVVDGDHGSTSSLIEDTPRPFRLTVLKSAKGRGVQLNKGAERARGNKLVFLHVDTQLPRRALSGIDRCLRDYEVGSFSLGVVSHNLFVTIWAAIADLRSKITRIPYGDQVQFMRRATFRRLGGFDDIPIMEDVSMMLKVKRRGIKARILDRRILTSDRRWKKETLVGTTLRNWLIYLLYRTGVPAERLERWYRPVTTVVG